MSRPNARKPIRGGLNQPPPTIALPPPDYPPGLDDLMAWAEQEASRTWGPGEKTKRIVITRPTGLVVVIELQPPKAA